MICEDALCPEVSYEISDHLYCYSAVVRVGDRVVESAVSYYDYDREPSYRNILWWAQGTADKLRQAVLE